MLSNINHYLNRFKSSLHIDQTIKDGVAEELYTHLEEKTQELEEKGLSKEEASKIAVQSLGSPELIAEQIYETPRKAAGKKRFSVPCLIFWSLYSLRHITGKISYTCQL